ncbi:protein-L-isoaspartate O-methyltransferase [Eikenella sp. NML080894]|uniref:protein-L-isoaspartate O-methyltransferase family protein n=1 Tax=Eikenella TaxID=538 RepID=UPI0007E19D86|nr:MULTISPECIES: protein-L-isoaspartate O-methyltransferase [Eikenella]OAM37155.1 protein-L-isoaspartate O-methyltransferase [Eikenella sp. NML080894]OAM40191.1 protein-L-isoaspartate O-methyltransferase [Eikenella sp. NML120348]OAM46323.1 protein-L-isoaspartate O-methyltransferase [Eikenella sp. NML99-0057]
MNYFEQARFNMVEQQIRPWSVLDFDVLDTLAEVPREQFVAPEQQAYAYADLSLPLPNGSAMLEPKVVARLIQGLKLTKKDTVLEIGTGSGYATAVLAKLAGRVITIDTDETQQQKAKAVLDRLGLTNIDYRIGDGLVNPPIATVSAIYVGGSCPVMPETLRNKLPAGGRMAVIVGQEPVMRALLVQCNGEDRYEQSVMFDTVAPALSSPAVKKASSFRF